MSEHVATIEWSNTSNEMAYTSYPRDHVWRFEDGDGAAPVEVAASAAPGYLGNPGRVDPEQALVGALSSCHMLTFLALSSKGGHVVLKYLDRAVGRLEKNKDGALAITRVELRPEITFAPGTEPDEAALASLHHKAHELCFIANSVRTEVTVKA